MVLDRLFLWIFTTACLVGTFGIILQAPTIYDDKKSVAPTNWANYSYRSFCRRRFAGRPHKKNTFRFHQCKSHPLVGGRHILLTCSRLQRTFNHWLHCASPRTATTLFGTPAVDLATALFQSLLLELRIGCWPTWRPYRARPTCSNAVWRHFCLTLSAATDKQHCRPVSLCAIGLFVIGGALQLVDIWHFASDLFLVLVGWEASTL